jgi:UDP-N-acetyl-D-mannosaminuronic acid dehydrogenase
MKELIENDRIVGGKDKESAKIIGNFYRYFVKGEVYETDTKTAEMCKLVENSFRDVNIAFANEISMLCDKLGINVLRLIELANKHPRVNILKPGVGVGGHCIAVDPWFIVYSDSELSKLIRTAREVNNYKTQWVIEKIKNYALKFEKENRLKPKIACLGLAFKPDVDDLRESPALYVVKRLINEGYDVLPVEPNVNNFKDFQLFDIEEAVKKADIITFLVAHKEFKKLNIKTELDFCGVTKYASSCY